MDVPEHQKVQVEVTTEGDRVTATVGGEIDAATAERFEQELIPALANATSVVLDLTEVSFMDSSGLRALVTVHSDVTSRGGSVALGGQSSAVERLLSVTGLNELFTDPS
jgi:anti-anti-sigma factor